ncbi:MAG TPA: wax ester/triacylglycerol synthase family O-acyltransferase [Roseiflexaceae bacterium]|nr:wax ester/triacylglycerol synthase family O-acyltransferase [Roseiflexaceae bacterium]
MAEKRSQRLSRVDTAWLRMEDPTNLMMVTGMLVFDQPLNFARLRETIEQRLLSFDRFRQRVVSIGGAQHWQDDPYFTLNAHLHRIALPAPHDQTALQDLVSTLMSTPLDHSKSPWQFHLIEEYGSGCVLLTRLHHCIADGIALMRVLLSLTDPAADAPAPGAEPARNGHAPASGPIGAARAVVRGAEKLLDQGIETLLEPARLAETAQLGASSALALSRLLLMSPDQGTLFKGSLGVSKRAAWSAPVALEQIKAIGHSVGATVNDVLLAAVTGALRRYLQGRGERVDGLELRAAVPVNLRSPDEPLTLGNRFGLVFLPLPVGADDPLDRLFDLKQRMQALKGSPEALVTFGVLGLLGVLTDDLQDVGVALFGAKATAVMTNVPGPRQTIYLAGAPARELMFWVPQSGRLGLGVSIISYAGQVRLGVATDLGLVPDPEAIVQAFHEEFELLGRLVPPGNEELKIENEK